MLFLGICALLLAASVWGTIAWSLSMATMDDMPMPGNWAMSMVWMRVPGRSWLEAAAAFLGMWTVMMVAMMLPSLLPMLWRFREAAARAGGAPPGPLTTLAGLGYFILWTAIGMLVYPLGVALAAIEMREPAVARFVPFLSGVVVLAAGALQFSAWKAGQLACCRGTSLTHRLNPPVDALAAIRHGLRLGLRCAQCCAGPMAVLLALGVMDLRAMGLVSAAITAERVAPAGRRVAQGLGVVMVSAGALLVVQALMPG